MAASLFCSFSWFFLARNGAGAAPDAAPVNIMSDLGRDILKRQLNSVANSTLTFLSKELYNASMEFDFWQNIAICIAFTFFVCLVLFLLYFKRSVSRELAKLTKKIDELKPL